MKVITLKITQEDYDLVQNAVNSHFDDTKHRKNYGIGSFLKEAGLAKAKRVLRK